MRARKSTFDARLAAAKRQAGDAISLFEKAAVDLTHAAHAQHAVANELSEEIVRLAELRNAADEQGDASLAAAEKIRGLFS